MSGGGSQEQWPCGFVNYIEEEKINIEATVESMIAVEGDDTVARPLYHLGLASGQFI